MALRSLMFVVMFVLISLSHVVLASETFTVCESNCDFVSITKALESAKVGDGDTLEVLDAVHIEAGIIVAKSVTIQGISQRSTKLQAAEDSKSAEDRVFHILPQAIVVIENVTIQFGKSEFGGGIFNEGVLEIINSSVSNNVADKNGGGIFNTNTLTIRDSTISRNKAGGTGGGIYNVALRDVTTTLLVEASKILSNTASNAGGLAAVPSIDLGKVEVHLKDSEISGNSASEYHGGLYSGIGTLTSVTRSTISRNNAVRNNGGIGNFGTMSLFNSTISGNSSNNIGGGLGNHGTITLDHITIADNKAMNGGGIWNTKTLQIKNSIVVNNSSGLDCLVVGGRFEAFGHNLDSDGSCSSLDGSFTTGDPKLGSLTAITGITPTHALPDPFLVQEGELGAAMDVAFDCTTIGGLPVTEDQRGIARPQRGICDIGAFESVFGGQVFINGDLSIDLRLIPETRQNEAVLFTLELDTALQLNFSFNGITLGTDARFDLAGPEITTLTLATNLGALSIFDQFIFANPRRSTTNGISPTLNILGVPNGLAFFGKRIELRLNIAGITITNLAAFEDVDFPPKFSFNTFYFVGQTNTDTDDQTPTFVFGDFISVVGQTVSGITLSSETAICFNPRTSTFVNFKRFLFGSVDASCAANALLFDSETISVRGIRIANAFVGARATFRPQHDQSTATSWLFESDVRLTNVLNLADVLLLLTSDTSSPLKLGNINATITSNNLRLTFIDNDADFAIDRSEFQGTFTFNPRKNPIRIFSRSSFTADVGLTAQSLTLSVQRGVFEFNSSTIFSRPRLSSTSFSEKISWVGTSFSVSLSPLEKFVLRSSMFFSPSGLSSLSLTLSASF